jgi:hypothetical protein
MRELIPIEPIIGRTRSIDTFTPFGSGSTSGHSLGKRRGHEVTPDRSFIGDKFTGRCYGNSKMNEC